MVVRGKVKNGKVVLTDPKALPDGMDVEVRPVKKSRSPATKKPSAQTSKGRGTANGRSSKKPPKKRRKFRPGSIAERMAPFIGIAKDLPPDMSVNLDHYLYGHPKQE